MNNKKSKLINKIKSFSIAFFPTFLTPIIIFYLFESFTHNPFETMKISLQILNIVFFELVTLFLLFCFGRIRTALHIETLLFCILGLAEYYVLSFRSAPIMPWDIYSIGTAASVADNFKYTLDRRAIIVIISFIVLFIIEFFFSYKLSKKIVIRVSGIALSLCTIILFTLYMQKPSTISRYKIYDKLFTPTTMSYKDGTAVAFLIQMQYLSVDKPAGYSAKEMELLLSSYGKPQHNRKELPNIIVIMNEAFSDPAVLGDFETNEDYMPFVHSLMRGEYNDTISGYLNVSVLGGNTANTEFEFLTGNTMAFLPQGSVAYQQYLKHPTDALALHLKELGYSTVAMHPYNSTGWNRNTVYPMLGFDSSYFISSWKNPEKIRKYVSDKSCYDKIINEYENKASDTPLFIFNVTMQNHSSYSEEFDNFSPDISLVGAKSKVLSNYLSLIKISDNAIENLINYFANQDEDTVIVFFGDHQPTNSVVSPVWKLNNISSSSLTQKQEADRYKVPFFIWANYDIPEISGMETSANYLSSILLSNCDVPLSNYQRYLLHLMKDYPVLSSIRAESADGISTPVSDIKDDLSEYSSLQYYQLFGKKK